MLLTGEGWATCELCTGGNSFPWCLYLLHVSCVLVCICACMHVHVCVHVCVCVCVRERKRERHACDMHG